MKVEHVQKNGVMVIQPKEKRLDAGIAAGLKSKLAELVEQGHVNMVINLAEVDLVDSSGLGVLVSALKKVGSRGEIKICNLKEGVRSLFELTRLDKVFSLYHSESEAVDSFK
jgi:anti-sigma B factor antagonist